MRRRSNTILWTLVAVSAALLLLVAPLLTALLIFDDKPFPPSSRKPNSQALKSALEKLDTFSKTRSGKKKGFAKIISDLLLHPVQTVVLNKDEVNALIDAGLVQARARAAAEKPAAVLADASFDGELFMLKVSKDVSKDLRGFTPFGRYVNLYLKFSMNVRDDHLKLKVRSLKIGDLPVPGSLYADSLGKRTRVLEKTRDGREILKIVRFLKIDRGAVTIKYDAKELMLFLMEKLPDLNKMAK